MGLKIELKPGERVMLGSCVITNDDQRTRLLVEGNAPILREKDIMTLSRADTPAKRIYFAVQLMYTSDNPKAHHEVYFKLVRDILNAAPSMWPHIESINNRILTGELYKALKEVKKLIAYEGELLAHARSTQNVRGRRQGNGQSTGSGSVTAAQGGVEPAAHPRRVERQAAALGRRANLQPAALGDLSRGGLQQRQPAPDPGSSKHR